MTIAEEFQSRNFSESAQIKQRTHPADPLGIYGQWSVPLRLELSSVCPGERWATVDHLHGRRGLARVGSVGPDLLVTTAADQVALQDGRAMHPPLLCRRHRQHLPLPPRGDCL